MRILMSGQQLVRTSFALCLLALGSGCAELETAQQATTDTLRAIVPSHLDGGFWDDEGVSGQPKIVVSISKQRAYFLKGKT
ncbi:MAG: hypothetical protein ABR502_12660, partial [Chitinophagaceae bacterium]